MFSMVRTPLLVFLLSFSLTIPALAEDEPIDPASQPLDEDSDLAPQKTNSSGDSRRKPAYFASERQQSLAKTAKASELLWLNLSYPDTDITTQALALQQRQRLPEAQGAVLILHDLEQHADWPGLVHELRTQLPDSGWYTLSVNLPAGDLSTIPERQLGLKKHDRIEMTEALKNSLASRTQKAATKDNDPNELGNTNSENSEQSATEDASDTDNASAPLPETEAADTESASSDPIDINLSELAEKAAEEAPETPEIPYEQKALSHIQAGMQQLNDEGYRNNVIIAIGSSAELALRFLEPLAGEFEERGFALILIAPKLEERFQEDISESLGQEFLAPVLDLADGSEPDNAILAKQRLRMARAAKIGRYTQTTLPALFSEHKQKMVIRRIESWLAVYAPGMAAKAIKDPF